MKVAHIFANEKFEPRSFKIVKSTEKKGIKCIKILKPKKEKYIIYVIKTVIRLLKERPDIIHAHRISGYIPAIIAKLLGLKSKIIYDKHDIHRLDIIFDRLLFLSDYVFVNSEKHLKYIKKFKKESDVLHNYSTFRPLSKNRKDAIRKKYGLKKNDKVILFQGSISKYSNPTLLIESLRYIDNKNIKIVIVGWIRNDKLWQKLEKMFDNRVIYLGTKKYNEMNNIVGMSDICTILFSHSKITEYGDPNKLYEAIACKKPVIVTDVESIAPIVKKYNIGKVVNNAKDLAKALELLLNKNVYKKMIKNMPNLTWENEFKKYYKIILKLKDDRNEKKLK